MYVLTRQAWLKVSKESSEKKPRGKRHTSKEITFKEGKITDNNVNQSASGVVDDKQEFNKPATVKSITMAPLTTWIGKQLTNQSIPNSLKRQIITSHEKHPDGLMAIPPIKPGGTPRIVVPLDVQRDLVLQAHLDIHHQIIPKYTSYCLRCITGHRWLKMWRIHVGHVSTASLVK